MYEKDMKMFNKAAEVPVNNKYLEITISLKDI